MKKFRRLRLLPREEIHAVALGRRALDTSGAAGNGTKKRASCAAMHLRPFCITLLARIEPRSIAPGSVLAGTHSQEVTTPCLTGTLD